MYEVTQETIDGAHKPFDVVSNKDGEVGYIQEVSVNKCQPEAENQIRYHVNWFIPNVETKSAWWKTEELTYHCNLFIEIAKNACHPMCHNGVNVQRLFNSMDR